MGAVPAMKPLRAERVAPASVPSRLRAASARLVRNERDRAVYQTGTGHMLVVRPLSPTVVNLELYPAGCSC